MVKLLLILFPFLIFSTQNIESKRILAVIPTASYSHQMFYQQLWRELAIRGHEIVVVTTDPTNEVLQNFKEISVKETYSIMQKYVDDFVNKNIVQIMWESSMVRMFEAIAEFQLQMPKIQELLNNKTEHFDLFVIEHIMSPMFGFQHRFKCPMIGVVSADAMGISHEIMGNPVHYIQYPYPMLPYQENQTLIQRIVSIVVGSITDHMWTSGLERITTVGRKYFGKDMPPMEEILQRTDMLFVNANPLLNSIRPFTPSTISLAGGMHMKPPKELPTNLKDFLDAAKEGVIYFSLGSNVKSNELPLELRKTILDTFANLPYKILWKFEDDSLPGKPKNVMITKWAPQQDILRHKNIKLFITQGGLQSLEESLYSYIPVVVMPFFGDQIANAEKAKAKGMGLTVDRHNLNVEEFQATILKVIEDSSFKETVTKLALQIQDTPRTPLENAIWWIEYVLRHNGAQHLKGPKIPFYQYYYFDVLGVLGAIVLALVGLIVFSVKCICNGICSLAKCFKSKCTKKKDKNA